MKKRASNIKAWIDDPLNVNDPDRIYVGEGIFLQHDDPATPEVEMTYEDVKALDSIVQKVYPDGIPIEAEGEPMPTDGFSASQYDRYQTFGTCILGYSPAQGTAKIDLIEYDMVIGEYGSGALQQTINATLVCHNYTEVVFPASNQITQNILMSGLVVTGSAAHDYMKTYLPTSTILQSKEGYLGKGQTYTYLHPANSMIGSSVKSNIKLDGNIFNDEYPTTYILEFDRIDGYQTSYHGYEIIEKKADQIVDTVITNRQEMDALLAGWAESINAGRTSEYDAVRLGVRQGIKEAEAQLQGTVIGQLTATNAATQTLVDELNMAVAAAAAAAATVGEFDLSKMTLGQALMSRFPFCIPLDLANAFSQFQGTSTAAPVWEVRYSVLGTEAGFDIDMSTFDKWAAIVKWSVLIMFNIGLIMITRKNNKGGKAWKHQ